MKGLLRGGVDASTRLRLTAACECDDGGKGIIVYVICPLFTRFWCCQWVGTVFRFILPLKSEGMVLGKL